MSDFEQNLKEIIAKFDKEDKTALAIELIGLVNRQIEGYSLVEKTEVLLRRPLTNEELRKINILDKSSGITAT